MDPESAVAIIAAVVPATKTSRLDIFMILPPERESGAAREVALDQKDN
jgi:hypothetical protein